MSFWKEFSHTMVDLKSDFILLPEIWLTGMKSKFLENLWFVKDDLTNREKLRKILSEYDTAPPGRIQYGAKDAPGEELAIQIFSTITNTFLDFPGNFELRRMIAKGTVENQNNYFTSTKAEGGKKNRIRRFEFLDNHDMQRVMWMCKNDKELLTEFLKFLNTFDDTVIYYGTEFGLSQKNDFADLTSYADTEARRFMKWKLDHHEEKLLHSFREIFSE